MQSLGWGVMTSHRGLVPHCDPEQQQQQARDKMDHVTFAGPGFSMVTWYQGTLGQSKEACRSTNKGVNSAYVCDP